MRLRLGTRGSRLALAQTRWVAEACAALGVESEVILIRTSGDRLADVSLGEFGGKALFVREIEEALLDGRVDAGVHSLKDMPAEVADGLCLAAFPVREDPRDVLVSRRGGGVADLPPGARVGTSSLRRQALLLAQRPDVRPEPIRGNVDTRLAKLDSGAYDAVILAQAGLRRLDLAPAGAAVLAADEFPPAVGQGILALEARHGDGPTLELMARLDDTHTRMQALAERAFLHRLGAGCHTPVAGHARLDGDGLMLLGLVATPDGTTVLRSSMTGLASAAEALGHKLADELLARGARRILGAERERPA
ncbi:MAG TPA: hydroxymethylbilane synthase [Candidatus Methylomirabilis sp.]|nr:hydroxymethylbilane synthase [Candidatus Methylomirabilis sp.]